MSCAEPMTKNNWKLELEISNEEHGGKAWARNQWPAPGNESFKMKIVRCKCRFDALHALGRAGGAKGGASLCLWDTR